jgi:Glycoside hydrolase 97
MAMKSSYIYINDSQRYKKSSGEIPTKADVFGQPLRSYQRGGLAAAIKAGNQTAWIYDLLAFAKERNVRLGLWLFWSGLEHNEAYRKAFALYEKWEIAGVKIGFINRDDGASPDLIS